MNKSVFGIIGLGAMGKNLSLNIIEKGFGLSVYNRIDAGEDSVVKEFLEKNKTHTNLQGFTNLDLFVQSLEKPRKILIMIKAGIAIDEILEKLQPLLTKNDIIIDGGNSHFMDTKRRIGILNKKNIQFIGTGISGGEKGARNGPSIMPGGNKDSYNKVAPILKAIAAKDTKGIPCCSYIGPDGAGHFVKMVHNGIEYAEMQLLAELVALMSLSMTYQEIADMFLKWQLGDLSSYLLEITANILSKKEGDNYLLDLILDKAENKGTGSWSSIAALNLGMPNTMMTSAVFARYISSFKDKRIALSKLCRKQPLLNSKLNIANLKNTYQFARIINHHQGFELMKQASKTYNWNLSLTEIARIWTSGCIIKSSFMNKVVGIFKESNNLINNTEIFSLLNSNENAVIEILKYGLNNRQSLPTFWSSYNYWIAITTKKLPANLIQAQRDYFGAHTYQRIDTQSNQFFHTNWQ